MVTLQLTPAGPYGLRHSVALGPAHWHRSRGATIELAHRIGPHLALTRLWQRHDGTVVAEADTDATIDEVHDHVTWMLALRDDHTPFLELAAKDELLREVVAGRRGLRPIRTTVAQALVHGMAGQLVSGREAWGIERRINERHGTRHEGLLVPFSDDELRGASPATLTSCRLAPARSRALSNAARTIDLEDLRHMPVDRAAARLTALPQIGPWTAGVVALYGLGSMAHGIVGDLGLIRLCGNLLGRAATAQDTALLLERYAPWAGLASLHLTRHPLAHRRHGHRSTTTIGR